MRSAFPLIAAAGFLAFAGCDGLAQLALRTGLPRLTLALTDDPHLSGLAHYRLGNFATAVELLRLPGASATYNRGDALARAGLYRDAMAAFDAVIARNPGDMDALANRAVILPLLSSETESDGGSRAQGVDPGEQGQARNKNKSMTVLEAEEAWRQRAIKVNRPQESKALIANEQWLETMADEPGRYLKLRIAAEYLRRRAAGLAPPPADDPW